MLQYVDHLEVILVTYNHSAFIQEALESIEFQDYPDALNVKVFDDGSSDDTVAKIRAFAGKSRHKFEFVDHVERLGVQRNYLRAFGRVSSRFVAVLEGDDYWIDARHLSAALEMLMRYPSAAGVFSRLLLRDQSGSMIEKPYPCSKIVTCGDLALENQIGNFSSCVYRAEVVAQVVGNYGRVSGTDWLFNLLMADASFLVRNETVSIVYRVHSGGEWSGTKELERVQQTIDGIDRYNAFFGNRYADPFRAHRDQLLQRQVKLKYFPRQLQWLVNLSKLCLPPLFWKVGTVLYGRSRALVRRV